MADLSVWTETRKAVTEFMRLLSCSKCKQRPQDPIRYINCHHLFCSHCVEKDTNCFVCGVPIRPDDIRPDHITSTLVLGCDSIVEIVFSNGLEDNESLAVDVEDLQNARSILSSTRVSQNVEFGKKPIDKLDTILDKSNESDKTEKMEDSDDEIPSTITSKTVDNASKKVELVNNKMKNVDIAANTLEDTVKVTESQEIDDIKSTGRSIDDIIPGTYNPKKSRVLQKLSSSEKKYSKQIMKDVNKKNKKGETLLHQACIKRQDDKVKFLLNNGANPNTKDNANWTPLQEAVSFGLYNICEMLLEKGALPDTPGVDNRTPLHEAVINNRCKEAALLLRYDANRNVFDHQGKKPLDYCSSEEMREVLCNVNLLNESSERHSDINYSSNRSIGSTITQIVLLACDLSKPIYMSLLQLASKHKVKILNTFASSVTHVIVEFNQISFTKLTYDILLSILHGKWILSSDWIQICLSSECNDLRDIDLEIFEVKCLSYDGTPSRARINAEKQNPRLFNNCYFYFAMNSKATYTVGEISLTKESLIRLVNNGGGSTLSREPNPEDAQEVKRIPFHVAHIEEHPLYNCSHFIIYSPGKEEPRMKYNMPHIKTLPLVWLIECIEKFTLVDPALFGIM